MVPASELARQMPEAQAVEGKGEPSNSPAATMCAVGGGAAQSSKPATTRQPWGQGARMHVV